MKRDQLTIHNIPHLLRHPVGSLDLPVLPMDPLPAIKVEHHHALTRGEGLENTEVRYVGPGRDMEVEGEEEEKEGKSLAMLKIVSVSIREGLKNISHPR